MRCLRIAVFGDPLAGESGLLSDPDQRRTYRGTVVFGAEVKDDQVADHIRRLSPVADPASIPPGLVVGTLVIRLDPVAATVSRQLVLGEEVLKTLRQADPDRFTMGNGLAGESVSAAAMLRILRVRRHRRIRAIPPAREELAGAHNLSGVENDSQLDVRAALAAEPGISQIAGSDQAPARVDHD